ncbi:hypothetical protein [Levilactobacillus lindianensis]|uniref:hypothetical protein n=1 Tax=Levilactobacillus lindianensis TaxID=2486018 RepID=UPI000F738C4B|nr:hypothetical protein [Levilactobacillus lindianensis]
MAEQMAAPKVDVTKLAELDKHETIEYGDKKDPKSIDVTLRDPGYTRLMEIRAKQNIGGNERDYGEMANMINENVIINPRYAFADLNKKVRKTEESKEIELTGKHGKKPHILMKFPGYREALNLSTDIRGVDGADTSLAVLQVLNADVFRRVDNPDKPLDMGFWSENGGGLQAMSEAVTYFSDVMDHDGYASVLVKAITFLSECI